MHGPHGPAARESEGTLSLEPPAPELTLTQQHIRPFTKTSVLLNTQWCTRALWEKPWERGFQGSSSCSQAGRPNRRSAWTQRACHPGHAGQLTGSASPRWMHPLSAPAACSTLPKSPSWGHRSPETEPLGWDPECFRRGMCPPSPVPSRVGPLQSGPSQSARPDNLVDRGGELVS